MYLTSFRTANIHFLAVKTGKYKGEMREVLFSKTLIDGGIHGI